MSKRYIFGTTSTANSEAQAVILGEIGEEEYAAKKAEIEYANRLAETPNPRAHVRAVAKTIFFICEKVEMATS